MALITINGTRTNVTATASDVSAVTNLDQLSDVNVQNGLEDNELLQYNYGAGVWENTHEPMLETISQTISGTTLKQTQSGFEAKLKLQVYDNTSVGGDVLGGVQISAREDDGSGGDTFHNLMSVLRTDIGGGDRGGFLYLLGDVTEFTSQDELGNSTPFAFNVSRVLSPSADNFLWDDATANWNIHGSETGSLNGNVNLGREAMLEQWDGLYDVGTLKNKVGIEQNGLISLVTDNKIDLLAEGRTGIRRTTDAWDKPVLKLSKLSTDSQLDIPILYTMTVDGDAEYQIARTAAYRHAVDDNRYYNYIWSDTDGDMREAYRIREDAGDLTMRIKARTEIQDELSVITSGNTQLTLMRDTTDNTDAVNIQFAHDDTDNDIYTNLGRMNVGSPGADEREYQFKLLDDAGTSSRTPLQLQHDFGTGESRVDLRGATKISLADADLSSTTLEIRSVMNTQTNHDAINNVADLEAQTLSGDYKQNFNFSYAGDNVPDTFYKVGRIESQYTHGDDLTSGIRLMAESEGQVGINELNVFNRYVETNAPFKFAYISSGTTNPASPSAGDYFFNTTGPDLNRYNGTAWVALTDSGLSFYDANNNRLTVREGANWVHYSGTVI